MEIARMWSVRLGVITLLAFVSLAGCAAHKNVHYFAVEDEFGNRNYYRVTISGWSWGTNYSVESGSYSSAAVEVIQGRDPEIPILDLPIEHERVLDEAVALYHARLLTDGYALAGELDDRAKAISTLAQIDALRLEFGEALQQMERAAALAARAATAKQELDDAEKQLQELLDDTSSAREKVAADQRVVELQEQLAQKRAELESLRRESPTTQPAPADEDEDEDEDVAAPAADNSARIAALAAEIEDLEAQLSAAQQRQREARAAVAERADKITRAERKHLEQRRQWDSLRDEAAVAQRIADRAALRLPTLHARYRQVKADLQRIVPGEGQPEATTVETPNLPDQPGDPLERARRQYEELTEVLPEEAALPAAAELEARELKEIKEDLVKLARIAWYASLSTNDIVSMGGVESDDPTRFRKHVVFVNAKNINLATIASEVDSSIDSVLAIATTAKRQALERQAQREAKRAATRDLIAGLELEPEKIAELLFPRAASASESVANAFAQLRAIKRMLPQQLNDAQAGETE